MNVRFALSAVLLSFLASPASLVDNGGRTKRQPPDFREGEYYRGPPGHGRGNKFGEPDVFRGRGPGRGPPGINGRGPPGLNGNVPPGWQKPNHGNKHGNGRFPDPNVYPEPEGPGRRPDERLDPPRRPDDLDEPHTRLDESELHRRPPKPENRYPQDNCRTNEFRCGSGECIPQHLKCNNKPDCQDSSDEDDCDGTKEVTSGCVLPPQPPGGRYVLGGCEEPCRMQPGDKVPLHSILTYSCQNNYVLSGNTITVCVNDQWYQPPSCVRTCPTLSSSSVDIKCTHGGNIVSCVERVKPGTRASLSCKPSYKLPLTDDPAYRVVTCLEDGFWDRRVFRCLPECGTRVPHGNTLIINGFEAKVGIFPWHVGIYELNSENEYEQICGGTLISNNLVLSAAHCFYDEVYNTVKEPTRYSVGAGKHFRSWIKKENYAQKSDVENIYLPESPPYMGARGNFGQDIAVLKLKVHFELTALVRPICMDWDSVYEREQLQVGQSGKAVGWGKTLDGTASESLQEINMPFVPYDQCLSAVPSDFKGYITADKFCAGHLNGSSLCEGDSGGGLCFELHGLWYIRGIVSVSPVKKTSCDYNSYVGFTYVSHFKDWIRSIYVEST